MVSLQKIVSFLDKTLACPYFETEEWAVNGLQVETTADVKKVGFGVDASVELFKRANDCDLLIVHHGILWKKRGVATITGNFYKRLQYLIGSGTGLYAAHLPLDGHPKYGNNIQLCKAFGIKPKVAFAGFCYVGEYKRPKNFKNFVKAGEQKLKSKFICFKFNDNVKNVGFCSGGGANEIYGGSRFGIDTFVTGEPSHSIYHFAKENGINLVFAGHYASETLGVNALMGPVKNKFKIPVQFYDMPTGL